MCYVMGGAELRDVIESLPHNILEHLNVSYSPCLGCGKGEQAPPFIEVNGKRIAGVSKNSLIQIVKEEEINVIGHFCVGHEPLVTDYICKTFKGRKSSKWGEVHSSGNAPKK